MAKALKILLADDPTPMDRRAAEPNATRPANMRPDHPYALALPVWGDAGFFRSVPIDEPFPESFFHIYHWTPPNMRQTLNLSDNDEYMIWASGRVNAALVIGPTPSWGVSETL
jgi:hypothetical protein